MSTTLFEVFIPGYCARRHYRRFERSMQCAIIENRNPKRQERMRFRRVRSQSPTWREDFMMLMREPPLNRRLTDKGGVEA